MTVAELIEKLKEMPLGHEVKAYEYELADYDPIVYLDQDSESVFLITSIGQRADS